MIKARKAHRDKVILDGITMAFLPGAKRCRPARRPRNCRRRE